MGKIKYTVDTPEVIARCGTPMPNRHSIYCPHCGTPEVFCDKNDEDNQAKWFWCIKAFHVDDWSTCRSCDKMFRL